VISADWPVEWGVVEAKLLSDGIGGKVWRTTLRDGCSAIIKQASAVARLEIDNACAYLLWRDGVGAVRLLDRREDTLLLEDAGYNSLREFRTLNGDIKAAEIAGDVVQQLHESSHPRAPQNLVLLKDHFASLFERTSLSKPMDDRAAFLAETADLANRLLDRQQDIKPLHGDIHHDNILAAGRGWVAIDPKGLIGDAAYDAANMFQNPPHTVERTNHERILELTDIMAGATGRSPQAVLDYALAYSGLAACWWLEILHEQAAASTVEIGRAIGEVRRQVRS
jgi:streptomycin 6-kinase